MGGAVEGGEAAETDSQAPEDPLGEDRRARAREQLRAPH